jgi:hypothetical protein
VQAPAVVLEAPHSRIDGGAFVEVATVLAKKIGLHAESTMFLGDLLRAAIVVTRDHDHGVEMRMIEWQGEIEEIVETDADRDGFKAKRLESKFIGCGVIHGWR